MSRIARVDAIRACAALYVVLHHAVPRNLAFAGIHVGEAFRFGQEAVIVFFLISGFVIQRSFEDAADRSFPAYLIKRATRIYVPLIPTLTFTWLLASYSADRWVSPNWPQLAGNMAMLQDTSEWKPGVLAEPYFGNLPLWSLSYEWWFYMAFFLLWTRVDALRMRRIVVVTLACAACMLYVYQPHFLLRLPMYFAIWWAGAEFAVAQRGQEPAFGQGLGVLTLCLVALALTLGFSALAQLPSSRSIILGKHPWLEARHFAFAAMAVVLVRVFSSHWRKSFDLIVQRVAYLAPISYTLYIAHYPVLRAVSDSSPAGGGLLRWTWAVFGLAVFGYVLEVHIYPAVRGVLLSRLARKVRVHQVLTTAVEEHR